MSRIGKLPVVFENKLIDFKILRKNFNYIVITNKLSKKSREFRLPLYFKFNFEVKQKETIVKILIDNTLFKNRMERKQSKAMYGTIRQNLFNLILGFKKPFCKSLQLFGLGYKAFLEKENLVLDLGFSNNLIIKIPNDLVVSVNRDIIVVSGFEKYRVGNFASLIRDKKKPNAYSGKGIRYLGEVIKLKKVVKVQK